MTSKLLSIVFIAFLVIACSGNKDSGEHAHQSGDAKPEIQQDTIKKSVPKEEHVQIGNAHAIIKYHAPAVRGRTIWGGLVPYGDVWVTGAHSATSFEIDRNIVINEKEIPAGKYALFTIPDKESWTFIINKNWDQHLADEYDQTDDIIRVNVKPEQLEQIQERLRYAIVSNDASGGKILVSWEKIRVSLPFRLKE